MNNMSTAERQSLNQLSRNHQADLMIRQIARVRVQSAKQSALRQRGIATLHDTQ